MENTGGCDKAESRLADPLPVLDVLAHGAGLELLLLLEVEDLQCPRLRLEGDDLALPVHDSTVGLDGPPCDIVVVLELDDDDFGLGGFALLLADAHVRVGFECLWAEWAWISTKLESRNRGPELGSEDRNLARVGR